MNCYSCNIEKDKVDLVEIGDKRLCLKCYTAYKLENEQLRKSIKRDIEEKTLFKSRRSSKAKIEK